MDFSLIFDITVLVIMFVSAVVSFLRGFVREVLTIVGLVGAALMALVAGPELAPSIENWFTADLPEPTKAGDVAELWGFIPYDIAASAIAYLGVFVITLVILSVISHFIAKSVHAIGMGPVDRSLGVVFGLARGFVLIGLLFLPFYILMDAEKKSEWFGKSNSITYVEYSSNLMLSLMPESWNRDGESADEDKSDPLKDLTGEHDKHKQTNAHIGTDEDAADAEQGAGYNDMERKAIDALIENQDRLKDMIDRGINKNNPESKPNE